MLSYQKLDADWCEDVLSWPTSSSARRCRFHKTSLKALGNPLRPIGRGILASPGDLMSQTNSVDVDVLVVADVDGRSGR